MLANLEPPDDLTGAAYAVSTGVRLGADRLAVAH